MSTSGSIRLKKFDRQDVSRSLGAINWNPSGKVIHVVGTVVEARLPGASLGTIVNIVVKGQPDLLAEVVESNDDGKALLFPFGSVAGVAPGASVTGLRAMDRIPVGDFLLGRVIDPLMAPLIGKPLVIPERAAVFPLDRDAPNPMSRARIDKTFSLGIRALDGLLTFGEGQRLGIMAGAGVGKSVLLGMIAKGSDADVNVIALVGERGREVREFLERDLGAEGLSRSVVVASTSDQSPLMKIRAAKVATTIAEAFSAEGKRVLLMMDSLTRVATAQREIGIAAHETPTTKGYPPSTFALLPRLLERCGPQPEGYGSISGLYTVLVDGDDLTDPVPDAARAILDGHIILSRSLANRNHFPAIDVPASISRVMRDIVDEEHWELAATLRTLLGTFQENFDAVQFGAYQAGSNPTLDAAISLMPQIDRFLRQGMNEKSAMNTALDGMRAIFQNRGAAAR